MSNSLLEVPGKIYASKNVVPGSFYAKCINDDLITAIHEPLKRAGYYLTFEGVYKKMVTSVGVDTPWHHVKHLRTKKCGLDHNVKFDVFGFVPPRCLECWKIVVYPRTIEELFKLLEVEQGMGLASKCGIDLRNYVPALYDGFYYNGSLEEGRHKYELVRKAVDDHISKDVRVILKRACTEYEMVLGPSPGWHMTKAQHEINEKIDAIVDLYTPNTSGQTKECLAQVHSHWVEWAWKHSDPTVGKYIGGDDVDLYPKCVTYHEGEISEIKRDMMRAKAKMKHDIEPEVVDAIHAAMRGFDMTKKVDLNKMGAVLGYESINPLYAGEGWHD